MPICAFCIRPSTTLIGNLCTVCFDGYHAQRQREKVDAFDSNLTVLKKMCVYCRSKDAPLCHKGVCRACAYRWKPRRGKDVEEQPVCVMCDLVIPMEHGQCVTNSSYAHHPYAIYCPGRDNDVVRQFYNIEQEQPTVEWVWSFVK